ncbi:RbsB protein [Petralouisia muris]|jgi:ribose transport system substrate-binding protein|uniref:RbsB protein n=1 Tax=Petralouisia muris TaxID=3032872 RepID=A0AC61RQ84_9FIRM|nr:substrate-binding domain-containing protein [Petralouisia muris]TGY90925.1 RbsB protein [Petralouisia muris]
MKKKVLAVLLTAAMAVSLTACGTNDGGNSANDGSSNQTQESSNDASDSAEEPSGEGADGAEGNDAASDDSEGFNPDKAADAMTIEEVREKNGAEVPVDADKKLGVVMKSLSNEFWRTLQEGYEAAAEDTGLKIDIQATTDESDETGQQTMTEALTTQGVNALLMSPISDSNLTSAVESANDADVLTVNVNDGLIAEANHYVGPNAYMNGQLAAEWISNKLGDEGQVAIVVGMAKAFAARERTAGFKEWITDNNSKLEVVAEQNADWDRQKAKELANTWITQYPDLKAIFCNNDDMALGVVEAVEESGADILVVGVDGIGEAYDSIRAGKLDATVDSFPFYMAQVAVECTLRSLAGQELPSAVATPQALIDSENVDTDAAEIINWTAPAYQK